MKTELQLQNEAIAFFRTFVDAFSTFNGAVVAQLFCSPYLAVTADGTSKVLSTSTEIADYFQQYLNDYRSSGCQSCVFQDLETVAIGSNAALFTVTWQLFGNEGAEISSWRESYNVVKSNNNMVAYSSVDHAA